MVAVVKSAAKHYSTASSYYLVLNVPNSNCSVAMVQQEVIYVTEKLSTDVTPPTTVSR